MYRVVIIDDEPLGRELVAALLGKHPQFAVVAQCADGFEGFKAIQQHTPDLIFLDIQMPKLSGFEMLELLEEPRPGVIFTTAFDQYALDAFEAQAIDYLLKPITKERFDKAIARWQQRASSVTAPSPLPAITEGAEAGYQQRIVVKDRDTIRIIPATEIHYIEASDDYIKIVTSDGSFLKKNTLGNVEQSLDPKQFVRVHRSYLIPVSQLDKIELYEKEGHIARLQCGAKVLVSKSGMAKLKAQLGW
jgi:two-component system LytT family response regulator